jgi:hypothetical protein
MATPVAPVPTMSAPIVGGNSTVPAGTGSPSMPAGSATKSAGASGTASSGLPQNTGAAGSNFVNFGGLALAVGAAMLA